jgi:hypothetical protein
VALLAGLSIGLAPVIATNLRYLGTPSPSSSLYTGWQLFTGANAEASGRFAPTDADRLQELTGYHPGMIPDAWEAGTFDRTLLRAAVDRDETAFRLFRERVRRDPWLVLSILPAKFAAGWSGAESAALYAFDTRTDGRTLEYRTAWLASQAWWMATAALAALGLVRPRRRAVAFVLTTSAIVVAVALGMLVLEAQPRYKEYVVPLLAILAALAIEQAVGSGRATIRSAAIQPR